MKELPPIEHDLTTEGSAPVARPRVVAWLGYGGLIPFLVLSALTCLDRERRGDWHEDLRAYGAVILSFVGALHWGFAMLLGNRSTRQRDAMFAWSVVPSLIAFVSLIARSATGDILLMSGFLVHYWRDTRLASTAALPSWYLTLRLRLSAVAILCLVAGDVATGW